MNQIKVERGNYEKNGKNYFTYFIKGNLRGKDFRLAVMPKDIGGYTVLDIVFGNDNVADLVVTPGQIKDDAGNIVNFNTYVIKSVDEDGTVYECPVKPAKQSDKSLLNMLLSK